MKIKSHRDEPLNERTDDLADEGKTLTKSGDICHWTDRTTRGDGRRVDRTGRLDREVGDSSIGTMDTEGDMKQNGDKNDVGTDSHYPGNHYVDNRLLVM